MKNDNTISVAFHPEGNSSMMNLSDPFVAVADYLAVQTPGAGQIGIGSNLIWAHDDSNGAGSPSSNAIRLTLSAEQATEAVARHALS
jgi:hypothetical protein